MRYLTQQLTLELNDFTRSSKNTILRSLLFLESLLIRLTLTVLTTALSLASQVQRALSARTTDQKLIIVGGMDHTSIFETIDTESLVLLQQSPEGRLIDVSKRTKRLNHLPESIIQAHPRSGQLKLSTLSLK